MPEPTFDPEAILATLERYGVRHVLIGGLAATLYGSPHVTTDVDITPSTDADNLARLAEALVDLDARLRVENQPDGVPFDRSAEALAGATIWNLVTRHGALDLNLAPSGTTGFDDLRREMKDFQMGSLLPGGLTGNNQTSLYTAPA